MYWLIMISALYLSKFCFSFFFLLLINFQEICEPNLAGCDICWPYLQMLTLGQVWSMQTRRVVFFHYLISKALKNAFEEQNLLKIEGLIIWWPPPCLAQPLRKSSSFKKNNKLSYFLSSNTFFISEGWTCKDVDLKLKINAEV